MQTRTIFKTGNLPKNHPSPKGRVAGDAFALVILTVVTLACLLPFLGKAFHIDDPLFIWCGRHILSDPCNFYHFQVNWFGKEEAMATAMQNPPLASYYLALIGLVFGWSETALHAGFLVPALAAVWGTYRLAKRFCNHPLAAGLVAIAAPVFLVSGTSVMCDTMMLAFWVWALVFWMEGLAKNNLVKLWVSAVLMAACGLTKYFGFALMPLVLAYSLAERRRVGSWLACIFFPFAVLLCYEWLTHELYGRGALLDGLEHARNQQGGGSVLSTRIWITLSFSGGSMIMLLLSAPLLWRRRALAAGTAALVLFGLGLVARKKIGQFPTMAVGSVNWPFVVQFTLFVAGGAVLVFLATAELLRHKTADALLLFLWVMGTFFFVLVACWQISGRYLLPLLPVASILIIRRLEIRQLLHDGNQIGPLWLPLGVSLVVALMVAWADFKLANAARSAAAHIQQEVANAPAVWFEGHWGFQYYMELQGARPVDVRHLRCGPNDALILPLENSYVFNPPAEKFVPWFNYDRETLKYLTTMSASGGAGFYSDDWGPMPFAFCRVPAQQYEVFRAK